jgi:hypothetical protein
MKPPALTPKAPAISKKRTSVQAINDNYIASLKNEDI